MKKILIFILLVTSFSSGTFAKRDSTAWLSEKNLEQQYLVFKKNLYFWEGRYFLSGRRLDAFHGAMMDTIANLEKTVNEGANKIELQKQELETQQKQFDDAQKQLNEAIKLKNSIKVLGMNINKGGYSITMYLLIIVVLVFAGFVYMLFQRSSRITRQTKKEYEELKQEYEKHRKNALERYTKINMELHRTRLELKKKSS